MSSPTEICSAALTLLGQNPIADIDDASNANAVKCKAQYDVQRQAILREYNWNFAEASMWLQQVNSPVQGNPPQTGDIVLPAGYPTSGVRQAVYYYGKPSDCLRARTVNGNLHGWRVSGNVIASPMSPALLVYTANIEESGLFDSLFTECFSIKLASVLAVPILKDVAKSKAMLEYYMLRMPAAKRVDASEGKERHFERNEDSDWVGGRDSYWDRGM